MAKKYLEDVGVGTNAIKLGQREKVKLRNLI